MLLVALLQGCRPPRDSHPAPLRVGIEPIEAPRIEPYDLELLENLPESQQWALNTRMRGAFQYNTRDYIVRVWSSGDEALVVGSTLGFFCEVTPKPNTAPLGVAIATCAIQKVRGPFALAGQAQLRFEPHPLEPGRLLAVCENLFPDPQNPKRGAIKEEGRYTYTVTFQLPDGENITYSRWLLCCYLRGSCGEEQ